MPWQSVDNDNNNTVGIMAEVRKMACLLETFSFPFPSGFSSV